MPLAKPKRSSSSLTAGIQRSLGVLAGLLGAAIIAGAIWFKMTHRGIEIDRESLCPASGPVVKEVVLIDASDPLTPVSQEDIKNQITNLARAMPKFGLLELRKLDPKVAGGQILFSRCNPGDGRELSDIVANPERERKRWEEQFDHPLTMLLSSTAFAAPASSSPIMETIQWIGVQQFSSSALKGDALRLLLVSDMIQHSESYSQYRSGVSFEVFKKTPAYSMLRTDLRKASVTIFYVARQGTRIRSEDHIHFWEAWFTDSNGSLDRVVRVQGAR